jgi:hypothetical protein
VAGPVVRMGQVLREDLLQAPESTTRPGVAGIGAAAGPQRCPTPLHVRMAGRHPDDKTVDEKRNSRW